MEKHRIQKQNSTENERGFTLLELLVVILLFPLLFFSLYSIVDAANVIFRTTGTYSHLSHSAMQTLRHLSREVGQTSPLVIPSHLSIASDGNGNDVLTFQIPVDWDNDGDAVTGGLNPATEWGAYNEAGQTQSGNLNFWTQYRVVNNQLVRRLLDQSQSPVTGLEGIIANNVQGFSVTQNGNGVTMSITLSATDNVGQSGSARTLNSTFSSSTILRNAVN